MGLKSLSESDSINIQQDIKRRRTEIDELLKIGRTVIVFMSQNQFCYHYTGEKQSSGTGKSRVFTNIVSKIDLLSILPENINTIGSTGSSIDCRAAEPYKSFFNENKDHFHYEAYFNKSLGNPLYYIKGTNKVVASCLKIHNGNLLFIPTFVDDEDEQLQKKFIDSVIKLVEELKRDTGDFEQPQWSEEYTLPSEISNKHQLKESELELAAVLEKINKQKEEILTLESYKLLFTGTGRALEIQVGKVFEELGFSVSEGIPGRDDLILERNDAVAVVEVKGVSKSAAEKHAAQLEKWVSEYIEVNEKMPKGILVVNAFKDLPLDKRNEDDFPHQMVTYSERRSHCLISGLQLLCLYFDCLQHPEKANELLDELLTTVGVYNKYNWLSFIEMYQL